MGLVKRNYLRGLAAGALVGITAHANAQRFVTFAIEAGPDVPGVAGEGFRSTGELGFYKHPLSSSVETWPSFRIDADPLIEFDSYFTIDAFGPTAGPLGTCEATRAFYGDYGASAYDAASSGVDLGDLYVLAESSFHDPRRPQVAAAVFGGRAIGVSPHPDGGRSELNGVFLARLTVERTERVQGGARLDLLDGACSVSESTAWHFEVDGPSQMIREFEFVIRSVLVAQPEIDGFGPADVYDVWLIQLTSDADHPPCIGDANCIGPVNFADLTAVVGYYSNDYRSRPSGTGPGDANRDGLVDFKDFTTILANWQNDCPE